MNRSSFKFALYLFIFILVFSLTGCGKVVEKASQKAIEKAVEEAVGGEVSIQEDGIKIESKDGTFESGGDLKWPADAMGDLPIPKANVTGIIKDNSNKGCTVSLTDFSIEDANAYLEKLKSLGYEDGFTMEDKEMMMYSGSKDDGSAITFAYNNVPKEGTIFYQGSE